MTDGSSADERRRRGWVRRWWWLWALLALAVLGAAAYGATRSSLLDVDRIEVDGAGSRVPESQVLEVAAIRLGEPLTDLDLGAVDERLTALAWVAEVTVTREWSGTVRLRILERTPAVVAVDPVGRRALLDAVGAVLEEVPSTGADPQRYPTIRVDGIGPPGSRVTGIAPLLRAAEAVPADLGAWIVALVATGDGVRAELVGGAVAELGLSDDYRDQARALATVLTRVTLACLAEVDVTVPDNPVVRRSTC